jgi:hypothetical protein
MAMKRGIDKAVTTICGSLVSAANRRHDQTLAHSPWFRLWQRMATVAEPNPQ